MEHMACCQNRLSLFIVIPISTQQISIATNNLLSLWIPYDKLLVTIVTSIEFIDIHILSRASASFAECYLTESTYLLHHIRSIMGCDYIYLIMTLVSHTELTIRSKFTLENLFGYRLDNFLFHSLSFLVVYSL